MFIIMQIMQQYWDVLQDKVKKRRKGTGHRTTEETMGWFEYELLRHSRAYQPTSIYATPDTVEGPGTRLLLDGMAVKYHNRNMVIGMVSLDVLDR